MKDGDPPIGSISDIFEIKNILTPLDRQLKWHFCIRKGYITLKKVKMKVEPLEQSQSEFILFILDGVGGLLLIQTFLKNRATPSVVKILKLKLEYF